MKKIYRYFVSYNHIVPSSGLGIGNIVVYLSQKLQDVEDIRSVEEFIQEEYNLHEVIVLNYHLMGVSDETGAELPDSEEIPLMPKEVLEKSIDVLEHLTSQHIFIEQDGKFFLAENHGLAYSSELPPAIETAINAMKAVLQEQENE